MAGVLLACKAGHRLAVVLWCSKRATRCPPCRAHSKVHSFERMTCTSGHAQHAACFWHSVHMHAAASTLCSRSARLNTYA